MYIKPLHQPKKKKKIHRFTYIILFSGAKELGDCYPHFIDKNTEAAVGSVKKSLWCACGSAGTVSPKLNACPLCPQLWVAVVIL